MSEQKILTFVADAAMDELLNEQLDILTEAGTERFLQEHLFRASASAPPAALESEDLAVWVDALLPFGYSGLVGEACSAALALAQRAERGVPSAGELLEELLARLYRVAVAEIAEAIVALHAQRNELVPAACKNLQPLLAPKAHLLRDALTT